MGRPRRPGFIHDRRSEGRTGARRFFRHFLRPFLSLSAFCACPVEHVPSRCSRSSGKRIETATRYPMFRPSTRTSTKDVSFFLSLSLSPSPPSFCFFFSLFRVAFTERRAQKGLNGDGIHRVIDGRLPGCAFSGRCLGDRPRRKAKCRSRCE